MGLSLIALSVSCHSGPGGDGECIAARRRMLDLIRSRGIEDGQVLDALAQVPRHAFIPQEFRGNAAPYGDHPCPIGHGQTISQPYIVAYMTAALEIEEGEKVLEIGTGSGYQAAILAELGADVYSIEIVPELAEHARSVLAAEGYGGVNVLAGDGYRGWPEHAPFDAVIVTCAPDDVPAALTRQLVEGGRMVIPVGEWTQKLLVLEKRGGEMIKRRGLPVRFVPMVHGE